MARKLLFPPKILILSTNSHLIAYSQTPQTQHIKLNIFPPKPVTSLLFLFSANDSTICTVDQGRNVGFTFDFHLLHPP